MRWLTRFALLSALAPVAAQAQRTENRCTPTPVPEIVISKVAYLTLRPAGPYGLRPLDADERDRLTLVLQLVQSRFVAPVSLPLDPSLGDPLEADRDHAPFETPAISGRLLFTAHSDGRVSALTPEQQSVVPTLDSAVISAIERAASESHIGTLAFPIGDSTDADVPRSAELLLTFGTDPDSLGVAYPLAVLDLAGYLVTQAMALPDNLPPRYPERLLNAWVQGEVLATFVVGPNGRADLRTFRVIESSDHGFTEAVRRHLPSLRYSPARIGGCGVAMWVLQSFTFRIGP